ncbi:hypothetical protein H0E84_07125 [Luteimonas sp. SJ-92]|uniref:Uncharacterized protein n=1 Tax=Luteimonas salinisoli TaxID=2752307 RepID=A0A853JBN1_9GAMM|nr:hypothetical protein [Luteimonas salinisoli]NZA26154.1 hypothetical protein [Luteimonas salinisoli]
MNASTATRNEYRNVARAVQAPARPEPRVRDFGVGYGSSSGYANARRYASASLSPRFRFA